MDPGTAWSLSNVDTSVSTTVSYYDFPICNSFMTGLGPLNVGLIFFVKLSLPICDRLRDGEMMSIPENMKKKLYPWVNFFIRIIP